MRPVFVAGAQPIVSEVAHLIKILKQIRVLHRLQVSPIEALNEGVLARSSRLDESEINPVLLTPGRDFIAGFKRLAKTGLVGPPGLESASKKF